MTTGAAYGPGIYTTTKMMTANGYSMRYNGEAGKNWSYSTFRNKFIVGVVEIIKKKEYDKNNNYYIGVVQDDNDILLRYILIVDSACNRGEDIDAKNVEFEEHYRKYLENILKKKEEKKVNKDSFIKRLGRQDLEGCNAV